MAELEKDIDETLEEEVETIDVDETTENDVDETTENDVDVQDDDMDITYEQAMKRKNDLSKASKKIAELKKKSPKKQEKAIKTDNPSVLSKDDIDKIFEERDFYRENPEALAYKDKIKEYQNKGYTLEDSYLVASKKDKEIEQNREIYGKGLVKGNVNTSGTPLVSIDTFDRMTSKQQEDYTNKQVSKYGKLKFK